MIKRASEAQQGQASDREKTTDEKKDNRGIWGEQENQGCLESNGPKKYRDSRHRRAAE